MDVILQALQSLFSINTLLIVAIGSLAGVVLGAIPGMNGGIGVVILLPLTYTMDPAAGLLFLGAIYMTSSYGGSISGILINTPGTVEAACTAIEGGPMAKSGRAREALYYAAIASTIGGVVGVLALIFFTPFLAKIAVKFGPPEMFLVALCGLTIVGSLTGKSIGKGMFAALFGLFLGMIGINHISGEVRFDFGIPALVGGIDLIPAVIGFFAIAEMIRQATEAKNQTSIEPKVQLEQYKVGTAFKQMITKFRMVLAKSSIIGTFIGILPGTGGAIAAFLSYGEAKRTSKNRQLFGKGNPEGIVAAESANNAAVGGSMVPMLALGIPGSSTSAIMFGALMIHGLVPGPRLFSENGVITYTILIGMLLTVAFMFLISVLGIPLFSKILKVRMEYIVPSVIVFSLIGAYSVRNSMYDVLIALACGVIGVIFMKMEIPTAPVILGLILGGLIESNLVRTLTITTARDISIFQYIFTRPVSIIIVLLTAYLIYFNYKAIKKDREIREEIE